MGPEPLDPSVAPGGQTRARRLARKSEAQRRYKERDPARVERSNREWREAHPEEERARKLAWKRANPEKHRASNRRSYLKAEFGITVEQYDEMLAAQQGVCAICGGISPSGKRLAVDHDHADGRVRGLLCAPCNTALGVLENRLDEVRKYLGT